MLGVTSLLLMNCMTPSWRGKCVYEEDKWDTEPVEEDSTEEKE